MQKKYIVRLTLDERKQLRSVIKQLKGSSQKVRRAQILLKADVEGANWTDERIAEVFDCHTKMVENIRQRLVERGFEETFNGTPRAHPPIEKLLDGEQEAQIIALRLAPPKKAMPTGHCGCYPGEWSNCGWWIASVMKLSDAR
jgi:Homeodomain-like domain